MQPRVHHVNCISSCPLGGALMDGHSVALRARLACHCLLLETDQGLVLVDTGMGLRDCADPRTRLSWFFRFLVAPDFREQMTAVRQIERLGFTAEDVRHIVLTHLDFDHAGGLDDFPAARVHVLRSEREYAEARPTWLDRQRFRPQQWSSRERWVTYDATTGERWLGFDCVRGLQGLSNDVLLVPLTGHTHGHAGVAIAQGSNWVLLAGDAYFHHGEMDVERPHCTPGLRFYQWMMEKDRRQRLWNQRRLRELVAAHGSELDVICSHDPDEFERETGRKLDQPIAAVA